MRKDASPVHGVPHFWKYPEVATPPARQGRLPRPSAGHADHAGSAYALVSALWVVLVAARQRQGREQDHAGLKRLHAVKAVGDARDRARGDLDRAARVAEANEPPHDLQHGLARVRVLGQLAARAEANRRHAQLLMAGIDALRGAELRVLGRLREQMVGDDVEVERDRIHAPHPTLVAMIAPFLTSAELDELLAADRRGDGHVVIVDSRWYLDGRSGADAHALGHIPGAVRSESVV